MKVTSLIGGESNNKRGNDSVLKMVVSACEEELRMLMLQRVP
jgi:hypothetical protein